MPALPPIHLPLPPDQPPTGFLPEARSISEGSGTSTTFHTGLDLRDGHRCLICGDPEDVEYCHIIPMLERDTWGDLRSRNYVPKTAKPVEQEPRNGLSLCGTHHKNFAAYRFFIRYLPEQMKYVLVNYSRGRRRAIFHGKALKLEVDHPYSPFPSILLIHEMRVRGHNPFALEPDDISPMIEDVDWKREEISDTKHDAAMNLQEGGMILPNTVTGTTSGNSSGGAPAGMRSLPFNDDVIQEILTATRESASWKACVEEGRTSWDGTAEA